MKAEYNSLLYTYESFEDDINSIMMDIALEAEEPQGASQSTTTRTVSTNVSNRSNSNDITKASAATRDTVKSDESKAIKKTNTINKVIERVKALIKKIGEIFDSLTRKLKNRLRLMMETDRQFVAMYNKRKSMVKPHDSITVVSYQYINRVLDQPFDKLMKEIIQCMETLRAVDGTRNSNQRVSDIINSTQGNMIKTLLEPYVRDAKEEISSVQLFVRYIVERYRGDKKEFVYTTSQLPNIERMALNTRDITNKCNQLLRSAQDAYNKLKTLEFQVRRNSQDDKVIELVGTNAAKAATLYNTYSTLVHSYYELKLEQALNYRVILKRFYQF